VYDHFMVASKPLHRQYRFFANRAASAEDFYFLLVSHDFSCLAVLY